MRPSTANAVPGVAPGSTDALLTAVRGFLLWAVEHGGPYEGHRTFGALVVRADGAAVRVAVEIEASPDRPPESPLR